MVKHIEDTFPQKYLGDVQQSLIEYAFKVKLKGHSWSWQPSNDTITLGTLTIELHCDDADDAAAQIELNEFVAKHITQNFLTKFWNWLTL